MSTRPAEGGGVAGKELHQCLVRAGGSWQCNMPKATRGRYEYGSADVSVCVLLLCLLLFVGRLTCVGAVVLFPCNQIRSGEH